MAMNINTLRDMILSNFTALGWRPTPTTAQMAEAIAAAVIEHIKSAAEVKGAAGDLSISNGKIE